jgi:hypothetical protein
MPGTEPPPASFLSNEISHLISTPPSDEGLGRSEPLPGEPSGPEIGGTGPKLPQLFLQRSDSIAGDQACLDEIVDPKIWLERNNRSFSRSLYRDAGASDRAINSRISEYQLPDELNVPLPDYQQYADENHRISTTSWRDLFAEWRATEALAVAQGSKTSDKTSVVAEVVKSRSAMESKYRNGLELSGMSDADQWAKLSKWSDLMQAVEGYDWDLRELQKKQSEASSLRSEAQSRRPSFSLRPSRSEGKSRSPSPIRAMFRRPSAAEIESDATAAAIATITSETERKLDQLKALYIDLGHRLGDSTQCWDRRQAAIGNLEHSLATAL